MHISRISFNLKATLIVLCKKVWVIIEIWVFLSLELDLNIVFFRIWLVIFPSHCAFLIALTKC
jgi:hypothetical protein